MRIAYFSLGKVVGHASQHMFSRVHSQPKHRNTWVATHLPTPKGWQASWWPMLHPHHTSE